MYFQMYIIPYLNLTHDIINNQIHAISIVIGMMSLFFLQLIILFLLRLDTTEHTNNHMNLVTYDQKL